MPGPPRKADGYRRHSADGAIFSCRGGLFIRQTLALAIGGGAGAALRYAVGRLIGAHWGAAFPLATLLINLLGAFILGAVMAAALERSALSATARLALGPGFCGGFTTFSSWMVDSYGLLAAGKLGAVAANLLVSAVGGLLAVALGALSVRTMLRRQA